MIINRRSGWWRLAAWLGLSLLLGDVAAAVAARPLSVSALSGDAIWVCTAAGIVRVDRSGQPVSEPGDCVFCLPLLGGALTPPPALGSLSPPAPAGPARFVPAATHTACPAPSVANLARGPPAPCEQTDATI